MEKNYSAYTKDLIALCHILDDFKEFQERLKTEMPKYNRDFIFKLGDISKGERVFWAIKAKRFYNENKKVIDTINKYGGNLPRFIIASYYSPVKLSSDNSSYFFYDYISSHRDDLDNILGVLNKISDLGFSKIEFNAELDFTKEKYDVDPIFRKNYSIVFVDNVEAIPNYQGYVFYRTKGSNYRMKLDIVGEEIYQSSHYGNDITLNSLLFSPDRLPESISREDTFEKILELQQAQEDKEQSIRNSVDLNVSILDLDSQLSSTNWTISRLKNVENKEQLLDVLLSIGQEVDELKRLSAEYDSGVSEREPSLTPEKLEQERGAYQKRREWSRMHID